MERQTLSGFQGFQYSVIIAYNNRIPVILMIFFKDWQSILKETSYIMLKDWFHPIAIFSLGLKAALPRSWSSVLVYLLLFEASRCPPTLGGYGFSITHCNLGECFHNSSASRLIRKPYQLIKKTEIYLAIDIDLKTLLTISAYIHVWVKEAIKIHWSTDPNDNDM